MDDGIDPLECVDLKELERITKLSRATIYRRMAEGHLPRPCSPPGKKPVWRKVSVRRALERHENPG